MANTSPSTSSPKQPNRERGQHADATRSNKGGGAAGPDASSRPPRPHGGRDQTNVTGEDPHGIGANATGTNVGFTESQTKDVELSGGGGLTQAGGGKGETASQGLRGEDQLTGGASRSSLEESPDDQEPGVGGGAAGMLMEEE